jgi:hypothetical protein
MKGQTSLTCLSMLNECFRLEPPEVVFTDFEAGVVYESRVRLQNVTQKVLSVRVGQPSLKAFRVDYNESILEIAPGLTRTFVVYFKGREAEEITDEVSLRCQFGGASLKLTAMPSACLIDFPR